MNRHEVSEALDLADARRLRDEAQQLRDERIRALLAQGLDYTTIGKRVGCGRATVERVRHLTLRR